MMTHPYEDLPDTAFWRSAVTDAPPEALGAIWQPKFKLQQSDRVATAGSCFAQHVGRALIKAGVGVIDVEPPPSGMREASAHRFGYGLYSARYGNIYTPRQLLQLLDDVIAETTHLDDVWEKDGRFFDALRPSVEPDGLDSAADVILMRKFHLWAVARMLTEVDVFIFTLGLTEAWSDRSTGRVWPTCPGVIAGTFDAVKHTFINFGFADIQDDLTAIRDRLREINAGARMILSVSPVPLTATASGAHVLAATARSKAVLRAAAGEFAERHSDVDYFPAYEIVTNPAARGRFFAPNLRNVTPEGVDVVMQSFRLAQGLTGPDVVPAPVDENADSQQGPLEDDVVCEELLLGAFQK